MFSPWSAQTTIESKLITISVKDGKSNLDHAYKDIELIYIINGSLEVNVHHKTYTLNKFDFLIINSNELHSFKSSNDNLFVVFHFNYFQLCSLLAQENLLFICNSTENVSLSDQELRNTIEKLLSYYVKQSSPSMVTFWKKVLELISVIQINYLKHSESSKIKSFSTKNGHNERITEILDYIESNFREPLTLEEIASTQFITVPYLSKFFKKQTGKTFSQYLNKVRLAHAVDELINTNKSITRIALDNGFPNLAAFNRVFNEKHQEKPVEYRKRRIESIEKEEKASKEEHNAENKEALKQLRYYLDRTLPENPTNQQISLSERETHTIKIGKQEALIKYWNKVINIGYATDFLNSDLQEQITILQNDIGFKYARFWGLFSDEMNIEDYSGENITYNFSNINRLLDFLIKNRLKPFIELGPKPKIVTKRINQNLILQTSVQKSLEEWKNLLRAFLLHCIERYGIEEVESWYFEIWSSDIDPISDKFDQDTRHNPSQFEEYFRTFSFLKNIMNEIVPSAKVGGCGLTMDIENDKLDLFLNQWKLKDIQPDFFSVYLYSIENDFDKSKISKKNMLSTNPDYIRNRIKQLKASMRNTEFDHVELNITEWNISVSNRDYLHDSCFKAAYIVKNIVDNVNQNIHMMGYWMCSDIFSDFRDSKSLLHGGAGLITKSGIKKPSYHSFVLLKQLGEILVSKGDNYIVTKKSGDRYQILCFNYKHFDYWYYLHPEGSTEISEQYDIFENNDTLNISLTLQGITNGKYRIKEHRLNRDQGSVLDEWLNFGSVYDMKPDEIEYLKQRCVPYMMVDHAVVEENSIVLNGELQPHEVRLYELNLLFSE